MMENKFVGLMVGLTVGVLLFSGFLWPIVSDATATEETFTNSGFFYAKKLDNTSTDVLEYDHTNPTVLTINGTDIDMSTMQSSYDNVSIAFSEKWFIRYAISTAVIYLYETDTESSSSSSYASVSNEKDFTLVCANGTATITIGEDIYSKTISGDGLIISSEKAEYVMKKSNSQAYLNADSAVYGAGRTDRALGVQGTSFNAIFKASVDDGVTTIGMSPNTYTVSDSNVIYTDESGALLDLYKLSAFGIVITDGTNTGTITYNQIFVPTEITAEKAKHLDTTQVALIGAIGTLGAIVLIAAAAGAVRRLD